MQGKIYILQDQSKLAPMVETQWDAEHKLQELIAEYPDLLGDWSLVHLSVCSSGRFG